MYNSNEIKKNIGHRLSKARENKGLSRKLLCEYVNDLSQKDGILPVLNEATLKQWEYGNNQVNIQWLPYLCEALSCDIGYIFGEYECNTRVATDIVNATGLSFAAADLLQWFKTVNDETTQREKQLIESLLCSPDFRMLSNAYAEYREIATCSQLSQVGVDWDDYITLPSGRTFLAVEADREKDIALFRLTKAVVAFAERPKETE